MCLGSIALFCFRRCIGCLVETEHEYNEYVVYDHKHVIVVSFKSMCTFLIKGKIVIC